MLKKIKSEQVINVLNCENIINEALSKVNEEIKPIQEKQIIFNSRKYL